MLNDILEQIQPADTELRRQTADRWNELAKPPRGLGILEDIIIKISGIVPDLQLNNKKVVVMCADNGVNQEKVSTLGSPVTAMVAANMLTDQASVSLMAKQANASVLVVDVGMFSDVPGTVRKKDCYGTENILYQPAMSRVHAMKAIEAGITVVKDLKAEGIDIIASGEMGIGNTTTSSAVAAVLLDKAPSLVTGKGAGLNEQRMVRKIRIIEQALALHRPDATDPIDVLAKVGGFDIAALTGLFLGGALYQVPIIIDGFIASVAALLAARLNPFAVDYMIPSHLSKEPGANIILAELSLTPPLQCEMALGEGTGAVALLPLLDMALAVYHGMPLYNETTILEHLL